MSSRERAQRQEQLFHIVKTYDLSKWGQGFLEAVREESGIVYALDQTGQDAANDEPTQDADKLGMRILSPLALCLLLAAGPALAGSDFCDGGGDGPIEPEPPGAPGGGSGLASKADTDPRTSSCEVDMTELHR